MNSFVSISPTKHFSSSSTNSSSSWNNPGASSSDADEAVENDDNTAQLLLSESDVNAQMAKLRSKYPTSEAGYLAAARARNAAKQASSACNVKSCSVVAKISKPSANCFLARKINVKTSLVLVAA